MKDYQKLFNERLNERIGKKQFPDLLLKDIQKPLENALANVSFFSLGITESEYSELSYKATLGRSCMNMQQAFNALNVLKLATPSQMRVSANEYYSLIKVISAAFTAWGSLAEPYIQQVRDEVNTEAKEDAQKEQVRKNLTAGGHKGLAKNISLA